MQTETTFPYFRYPEGVPPPISVRLQKLHPTQNGHWQPSAFLQTGPALRQSGFLTALTPEDLQSFLLVASFLSSTGDILPTLAHLSAASGLSQTRMRQRLNGLLEARWHGQPLVLPVSLGNGEEAFSPVAGLIPVVAAPELPAESAVRPIIAAPREAIIEHTRRTYARPRAEVEREIEAQYRRSLPPALRENAPVRNRPRVESPKRAYAEPEAQPMIPDKQPSGQPTGLREELMQVGLTAEQAEHLVRRYGEVRIRRQLQWLPQRAAKNPAGYLLAAIKDDYAAPSGPRY